MTSDTYGSTPTFAGSVDRPLAAPGLPPVYPIGATITLRDPRTNTLRSTRLITYSARFHPSLRGRTLPDDIDPTTLHQIATGQPVSVHRFMREAACVLPKAAKDACGDNLSWALLITSPTRWLQHNVSSLSATASANLPGVHTSRYAQPVATTLHMPRATFDRITALCVGPVWEDMLARALRSGDDQDLGDVISIRLG